MTLSQEVRHTKRTRRQLLLADGVCVCVCARQHPSTVFAVVNPQSEGDKCSTASPALPEVKNKRNDHLVRLLKKKKKKFVVFLVSPLRRLRIGLRPFSLVETTFSVK